MYLNLASRATAAIGLAALCASSALAQTGAGRDTTKVSLPLEAARTIKIATNEGSWLSLDVSPDGQTIVFDLLGDVYTVPIGGGAARQVTRGMAFDAQPRFSPDGSKVLFISDRSGGDNLWTLELATGDSAQITKDNGNAWASPDWTPDGKYVVASKAAARLGPVKLWIGHVDGGAGQQLHAKPENLKTVGAAVSPDGRYIWYARRLNSWQYNAAFPQYQLWMYDRKTGEDFSRTARYGSAVRPTLSPDGKWLVYATRFEDNTGLRIRDLESGDERWLAYPVQRDDQESIADRDAYPGMSFTPDSKELVASYGGKIWRVPVNGGAPIEVPFQVDVELGIGPKLAFTYPVHDSAFFNVRQIRDSRLSPNGRQLAFTALDNLYVMDFPNGTPRRITNTKETIEAYPTWSPDGQWIAYVTWTPNGGQIMKVRANGSGGAPPRNPGGGA
jgi:Tol biopolymer transport system component